MSTPEVAAKIAMLRQKLIRTLVQQGADEQYAELYVDARVHFGDTSGSDGKWTGNVIATLKGVSDSPIGFDKPEVLRAFVRAMRRRDPTAKLGERSIAGETRQERAAMLRENIIDALILQGASRSNASDLADKVTIGVAKSDGPPIAALGDAQYEDTPQSLAILAGMLQSKNPGAFAL
jgi:hypothetical protein